MPSRGAARKATVLASGGADARRRALIDAAIAVFAERGYEAASVRAITGRAKVNQGAITYHFAGKEALYREVLRTVRAALAQQPLVDLESVGGFEPEEALRRFVRQTLAPAAQGPKLKRYMRVFAWEQLKPTAVRRRLTLEEPFPTVVLAERIVRRFRPDADDRSVAIATAALLGQIGTFLRDADWLALPPLSIALDRASLDGLVETLASFCLGALSGLGSTGAAEGAAGSTPDDRRHHAPSGAGPDDR